jgi:transketolase
MTSNIKKRLFEICFKHKLHHLGSYFSCLDIIDKIYEKMNQDDIFILSAGHAAVALYVVLEKYYGYDAEELLLSQGEHPKINEEKKIFCSTGSLGMGITVAVGRAYVNKNRKVYCLITDGECAEGSVWEALQFIKNFNLTNIEIHVNANGYCAYDEVDLDYLEKRLHAFLPSLIFHRTHVEHLPFLKGIDAHYYSMKDEDEKFMEEL